MWNLNPKKFKEQKILISERCYNNWGPCSYIRVHLLIPLFSPVDYIFSVVFILTEVEIVNDEDEILDMMSLVSHLKSNTVIVRKRTISESTELEMGLDGLNQLLFCRGRIENQRGLLDKNNLVGYRLRGLSTFNLQPWFAIFRIKILHNLFFYKMLVVNIFVVIDRMKHSIILQIRYLKYQSLLMLGWLSKLFFNFAKREHLSLKSNTLFLLYLIFHDKMR